MHSMEMKLFRTLAALALAAGLSVPLTAASPAATQGQNAPGQMKREANEQGVRRERHPEIRQVIKLLERARAVLQQRAARDFQGHRANAVQEINEAIAQLHAALQADVK
jgi:hypothetical protein